MSEEIDKTVFKKYEIQTKLGKGVRRPRPRTSAPVLVSAACADAYARRRTASCGRPWTRRRGM